MTINNSKIEIFRIGNVEILETDTTDTFAVKLYDVGLNPFNSYRESIKKIMDQDILSHHGVYFIELANNEFYIGETTNLEVRLYSNNGGHLKTKDVISLTFATKANLRNTFEKVDIQDIESIILDYAKAFNFNITNKKVEYRKNANKKNQFKNERESEFIWDAFLKLNCKTIIQTLATAKEFNIHNIGNEPKITSNVATTNKLIEPTISTTITANSQQTPEIDRVTYQYLNIERDENNPFYKWVEYRGEVSQGYKDKKSIIVHPNYVEDFLFTYLYEGIGGASAESKVLNWANDGYTTSKTLAHFRIQTNGTQKGILKTKGLSEIEAKKLISEFIKSI